ncbi:MAG: HDOD domain-containing protein [Candidatus Eisenbacteria sp.]|nr:HDOD domain-containing protein [Candidatus Eisenbacteria bacterium]
MAQKVMWAGRGTGGAAGNDGDKPGSPGEPTDVHRRRIAAEIESRINRLPPFPTVLSELIGLTSSATSAAADLRTCIEKDAVLAARILKLANSAFYCPKVPVASVQQAVVMLGHLSVKSLAMAAATLKFLGRETTSYGMTPGGLWMHSYAVAELARDLAGSLSWPDESRDAVHVGALLHDIGKIVLEEILPQAAREGGGPERLVEQRAVEQWEDELTGFTHSAVGRTIAEKWQLAPLTTHCIAFHHGWNTALPDYATEVTLVSLADAGAHRLGIGLEEPDEDPEREHRMLEILGVSEEQYSETLERWREKIEDAGSLFSQMRDESE